MGQFRKASDPRQSFLFPPSPTDWLPEDHLAWFILETVEQLDIDTLLDKYRMSGKGELAYPPRVLLSLLIYGYCTGTFASRKIAVQVDENIAFRVLARGLRPSFRTICRFREENLNEFQKLFVQVVQLATESGLVRMGTIAIDGSKVKASASKHKAMSYGRMLIEEKRLRSEIAKLTRAAKKHDDLDDGALGPDFRGDELPKELSTREARLATIQAAKKRLEDRKAAAAADKQSGDSKDDEDPPVSSKRVLPRPKDQENFTDPDSRIMSTGGKSFEQSYNAQIAVDAKKQIIVGNLISQSPGDMGLMTPVLGTAMEVTNKIPKRLLLDAGYRNESDLGLLSVVGIDGYVSMGGKAKQAPSESLPHSQAMHRKLLTKRGRARYRKRKAVVEPVFAWVKQALGFRSFSVRGLAKVAGEWNLVCLALNLRRMARMVTAR